MKNFVRAKATLLLLVFSCYFVLGCVPERESAIVPVETTISNIQERLKTKNYPKTKVLNPEIEIKNEVRKVFKRLETRGVIGRQSLKNNFKLTSLSTPIVDESATFGIDDPVNFDLVLNEATLYYNGSYSRSDIESALLSLNSSLVNYPMTYNGVNQFLSDMVNNGSITYNQRLIVEAELDAIANANTTTEILNIVNVVTQEISNSQLSQSEINTILVINAGVEGAIEEEALAYGPSHLQYRQTGVGAFIGGALMAVGIAVMVIAGSSPFGEGNRDGNVLAGIMSFLIGTAVLVMSQE